MPATLRITHERINNMKRTIPIPLVETGRLDHDCLPDDHPDLRGARGPARDAGISIERAQTILDTLFDAEHWHRRQDNERQ